MFLKFTKVYQIPKEYKKGKNVKAVIYNFSSKTNIHYFTVTIIQKSTSSSLNFKAFQNGWFVAATPNINVAVIY